MGVKRKIDPQKEAMAKAIRDFRMKLGLTQPQMARRIGGIELGGYSNWERGISFPRGDRLAKLLEMGFRVPGSAIANTNSQEILHIALDIVLKKAPPEVRIDLAEKITRLASQYR